MDDYIRKTVSGNLEYKYFETDDEGNLVKNDNGQPLLKSEDVPEDEDVELPDEYDRPVNEGKGECGCGDECPDDCGCGCHETAKTGTEGDKFESDDPLEWYDGQIRNVFEDDDEIYVRVRGEGGEDNNIPKDRVLEQLWESNSWSEDQIQQFEDEIEDMAD
jgi:hypothetical protein